MLCFLFSMPSRGIEREVKSKCLCFLPKPDFGEETKSIPLEGSTQWVDRTGKVVTGMMKKTTSEKIPVLNIELDREGDGRWIAEVPKVPGAMAYGNTKQEAVRRAYAVALLPKHTDLTPDAF